MLDVHAYVVVVVVADSAQQHLEDAPVHSDVLGSGKVARSELRWSPTCRNATEVCTQATHGTKHEKKGTTAIAQKNPHQHIA